MPKKQKGNVKPVESESTTRCPVTIDSNGHVRIQVQAKPGAKENRITDIGEDAVGIQIAAPPIDGEANTELLKYLATCLCVRKGDLSLDRGSKSRNKIVVVTTAGTTVDTVLMKLQKETTP